MSVETASYPAQLNTTWPLASDFISEGDDHVRLLKSVLKTTFPNFGGAFNATHVEANYLVGLASPIQTQLDGKGSVSGQTWTGTHVFPGTTTVGALTPTIQGRLATVTSDVQAQINAKGTITGQTWSGLHDYTAGSILVTTMAAGNNSAAAASTAFVASAALSAALPGQAGNAGKYITTDGATASWATPVVPDSPTLSGAVSVTGRVGGTSVEVAALAVDCSLSNYYTKTISVNSAFTFTNAPTGRYGFILEVNHTAGTITWPASVRWPNNIEPPRTTGKVHLFFFLTSNGGTTWRANALTNYAG